FAFGTLPSAGFKQCVGVPSTTHGRSPVFVARGGRCIVRACEPALCPRSGGTTYVSKPASWAARSSAARPGLWMPSSLERSARSLLRRSPRSRVDGLVHGRLVQDHADQPDRRERGLELVPGLHGEGRGGRVHVPQEESGDRRV